MICMQINFKYMRAALCVLLAPFFAAAADKRGLSSAVQVLTLEDAVNFALENNRDIKSSEKTLELLRTKDSYSWNSASPSLGLNGNFSEDFENNSETLSLAGAVNVQLSPNLYASVRGAQLDWEQGILSYEQTLRSIELSVRKAFYGLLYEQENIALQKQSLATAEAQYRQNQAKFRSGQIPELDVMTSRVNYEQKKPAVEAAEITFLNDLAAFRQIIGISRDTEISLSGSLDDVLGIQNVVLPPQKQPSPAVQMAQKNVEIAENSLLSSRFGAYGPSVTLGYRYGKTYRSQNSGTDGWGTENALSVGVQIPLDGYLPWSAGAVNISAAKTSAAQAQLQLEDAVETAAVQSESSLRKIAQAISTANSLRATAELARQTYELTKTAYNYGKTDLINVMNASDAVLSAEVGLKQQAYQLVSTILDLESLLGIPFGTLGFSGEEPQDSPE